LKYLFLLSTNSDGSSSTCADPTGGAKDGGPALDGGGLDGGVVMGGSGALDATGSVGFGVLQAPSMAIAATNTKPGIQSVRRSMEHLRSVNLHRACYP
jgi:hypothetical protein